MLQGKLPATKQQRLSISNLMVTSLTRVGKGTPGPIARNLPRAVLRVKVGQQFHW